MAYRSVSLLSIVRRQRLARNGPRRSRQRIGLQLRTRILRQQLLHLLHLHAGFFQFLVRSRLEVVRAGDLVEEGVELRRDVHIRRRGVQRRGDLRGFVGRATGQRAVVGLLDGTLWDEAYGRFVGVFP